jgi:hypothetical protein
MGDGPQVMLHAEGNRGDEGFQSCGQVAADGSAYV